MTPPCPQCTYPLRHAGATDSGARVFVCRRCRLVFYALADGRLVLFRS